MTRELRICVLGLAAAFAASPLAVQADTAPQRTLVYHFTYSSAQNITARDSSSGIEAVNSGSPNAAADTLQATNANGMSHYGGSLTDKGTMTVNVLGKQPDGGLIVSISEAGESIRRAPPAECVVYGNTNVICDPNKTVYTEEYTLLRFLGVNFVDPSQLDANRSWSFAQNKPDQTIKASYTINSNNSGIMQIGEVRSIKEVGSGHLETDIQTKIGYNFNTIVPTSVDEYATQYTDSGIGGSQRTNFQTTLQLLTDTMAKT